jgi:two-component system, OmpR family, sensor histidine kinase KdpD
MTPANGFWDATGPMVLAAVALAVSFLGFGAARRSRRAARTAAEAARRVAEADRMRAVLLATLGHDLRSPLAAAKAAVSGLRSTDVPLTADDIGPRSVTVRVPAGLPEVMADAELMERVIVNLARNALRYSPPGTPPLLTARAHGGRVELRVIDRGPGIPAAERDRAFLPFQRLGDTSASPGVGLGLALSRDLTKAMGGTLDPHETPGGGLTMVISLPAARRMARAVASSSSAPSRQIMRDGASL